MWTCQICGACVPEDFHDTHAEWHNHHDADVRTRAIEKLVEEGALARPVRRG